MEQEPQVPSLFYLKRITRDESLRQEHRLMFGKPYVGRSVANFSPHYYQIPVDAVFVSKVHCAIVVHQNGVINIEDTSTTGSFINGKKVSKNLVELQPRDVIALGFDPNKNSELNDSVHFLFLLERRSQPRIYLPKSITQPEQTLRLEINFRGEPTPHITKVSIPVENPCPSTSEPGVHKEWGFIRVTHSDEQALKAMITIKKRDPVVYGNILKYANNPEKNLIKAPEKKPKKKIGTLSKKPKKEQTPAKRAKHRLTSENKETQAKRSTQRKQRAIPSTSNFPVPSNDSHYVDFSPITSPESAPGAYTETANPCTALIRQISNISIEQDKVGKNTETTEKEEERPRRSSRNHKTNLKAYLHKICNKILTPQEWKEDMFRKTSVTEAAEITSTQNKVTSWLKTYKIPKVTEKEGSAKLSSSAQVPTEAPTMERDASD